MGGFTVAATGVPSGAVSPSRPTSWAPGAWAAPMSSGSTFERLSLARRNISNLPPGPTVPHDRYRNRSPRGPWTNGPRKSGSPSVSMTSTANVHVASGASPGTSSTTSLRRCTPTWTLPRLLSPMRHDLPGSSRPSITTSIPASCRYVRRRVGVLGVSEIVG